MQTTIMFTDIVDSTLHAERLGDHDWVRLVTAHHAAVRTVVATYGGTTVQTLGDGALTSFDDAVMALHAARELQRAVGALGLRLRIGMHTGDIQSSSAGLVGLAVHLAARIAATAEPDDVLVSETVRDLVAGSGFEFDDRGMHELKGFAERSRLFALIEPVGDHLATSAGLRGAIPGVSVPLPGTLVGRHGLRLVGRSAELHELESVWDGVNGGTSAVVLLAGEPGVGKSRLADEFARLAHRRGGLVLHGRCDDGMAVPYQPFVEAAEHLVHAVPPAALRPLLGEGARELGRLVADLATLLPGLAEPTTSEPETERFRLFQAVLGWLEATASIAPLMLVLDDLHWANESTLLMLEHVVSRLGASRVCLVATYRDSELGRYDALRRTVGMVRDHGHALRLSLRGLDAEQTAELVEVYAGHQLQVEGRRLAATIHEQSSGNPFFIGELLRHFRDIGVVKQGADGRWSVTDQPKTQRVPDGIRMLIENRLQGLSARARAVLATASLIGADFDVEVISHVFEGAPEDLVTALEEARSAHLVEEANDGRWLGYRFVHALVRATLLEEQSSVRRATAHAAIARAYEQVYAARPEQVLPELALHWIEAAPAGYGRQALVASRNAAEQALSGLAFEAAEIQFGNARELFEAYGGPEELGVELLIGLAEARQRRGNPDYRGVLESAWAAARRLGNQALLERAALACTRGYWSVLGAVDETKVGILGDALGIAGDQLPPAGSADSAIRTCLLAELAAELIWDQQQEARYNALSDQALAMARRIDEPSVLGFVISRRLATLWGLRHIDERDFLCQELLDLGSAINDPVLQVQSACYGMMSAIESVHPERLEPLRELMLRLAPTLGQPFWEYSVTYGIMNYLTTRGTPADIERQVAAGLELGNRLGMFEASFIASCQSGGRAWWRDTYEEVLEVIVPLVEAFAVIPTMKTWLAAIHTRLGSLDRAQGILDELRIDGFDLPADHSQGIALAECAIAAAALGDARAAAMLLPKLGPYADLIVVNPINAAGPIARYLGLLHGAMGERASAAACFERAADIAETMGGRMWLAHIHLDWAELLAGQPLDGQLPAADAREHALIACGLARELDLPGIERRAAPLTS